MFANGALVSPFGTDENTRKKTTAAIVSSVSEGLPTLVQLSLHAARVSCYSAPDIAVRTRHNPTYQPTYPTYQLGLPRVGIFVLVFFTLKCQEGYRDHARMIYTRIESESFVRLMKPPINDHSIIYPLHVRSLWLSHPVVAGKV